jgi:hypothetical protein
MSGFSKVEMSILRLGHAEGSFLFKELSDGKPRTDYHEHATLDRLKVVQAVVDGNLKHADFGPTLACEKLLEVHGLELSKETVRKLIVIARNLIVRYVTTRIWTRSLRYASRARCRMH